MNGKADVGDLVVEGVEVVHVTPPCAALDSKALDVDVVQKSDKSP